MIIGTTYLLPLARIEVETDLLLALAERNIPADQLRLEDIQINSISIFELQAKAAKLSEARVRFDRCRSNLQDFQSRATLHSQDNQNSL